MLHSRDEQVGPFNAGLLAADHYPNGIRPGCARPSQPPTPWQKRGLNEQMPAPKLYGHHLKALNLICRNALLRGYIIEQHYSHRALPIHRWIGAHPTSARGPQMAVQTLWRQQYPGKSPASARQTSLIKASDTSTTPASQMCTSSSGRFSCLRIDLSSLLTAGTSALLSATNLKRVIQSVSNSRMEACKPIGEFSNTCTQDRIRMMLHHSWMKRVRPPARRSAVANNNNADDDQLLRDVRVYALAEYFDVNSLKGHALQIFKTKVHELWLSESFVDCIREVYSTTNDSECMMRKSVVETARAHLQQLMRGTPFQDLISEGGDFVVDLMKACT